MNISQELKELAEEIEANLEDHPNDYTSKFQIIWSSKLMELSNRLWQQTRSEYK